MNESNQALCDSDQNEKNQFDQDESDHVDKLDIYFHCFLNQLIYLTLIVPPSTAGLPCSNSEALNILVRSDQRLVRSKYLKSILSK